MLSRAAGTMPGSKGSSAINFQPALAHFVAVTWALVLAATMLVQSPRSRRVRAAGVRPSWSVVPLPSSCTLGV